MWGHQGIHVQNICFQLDVVVYKKIENTIKNMIICHTCHFKILVRSSSIKPPFVVTFLFFSFQ